MRLKRNYPWNKDKFFFEFVFHLLDLFNVLQAEFIVRGVEKLNSNVVMSNCLLLIFNVNVNINNIHLLYAEFEEVWVLLFIDKNNRDLEITFIIRINQIAIIQSNKNKM